MEAFVNNDLKEAFVIGDIHGMHTSLEEMLKNWKPDSQQLIFVGDYVDRGPNSAETLNLVRQLQLEHGAICLRGNHEEMFLAFLHNPISNWASYARNGGMETVAQLLGENKQTISQYSRIKLSRLLHEQHPWLEEWLSELPYFVEFGDFVVVHAGLDLTLQDWRNTSSHDMVWIRQNFHEMANKTGKIIIFGHTPTMNLHHDWNATGIWHKDNKLGIDGGAVYGGSLLALEIDHHQVKKVYQVKV